MNRSNRFYLRWIGLGIVLAITYLIMAGPLMPAIAPAFAADSTSSSSSQPKADGDLPGLVGSWQVTTTVVKQDSSFPALMTFTGDGIVLADETPSLYETTGHGAWAATGEDSANFTFMALVGSESGALSLTYKVMGSLVYDTNADTWQGPFTIRITDTDGAEVLVDEGTFDARRIAVESLDMEVQETAQAPTALKPGDKIGEMVLAKGPDPLDRNIPPYVAFCNANPMIETGSTVAKPGVYTVECAVPVLPKLAIGFGWGTDTQEHLEQHWQAIHTELYVNGQEVDQEAFGTVDATIPSSGLPGEDPNKVIDTPLRTWNVMLENLQPGPLELRMVWHVAEELTDSISTTPAGDYDITFKITVDPELGVPEGEPEALAMIPEQITVFDAFNAAVNAHDVDTALGFFADDAVASFPNQPEPNLYKGHDEIRTWLENDVADNIRVEIENSSTSGDSVKATAKVQVDSLPPDLTLVGTVEVTVQDGKITSFTYTLSDEAMAALAEIAAQQEPVQLPVEYVRKIDTSAQQIKNAVSLAVDGERNVYVIDGSETPRVLKYDSEGNFVTEWGSRGSGEGQFEFIPPTPDEGPIAGFVAADAQGNVYITDSYNGRVQKFDSTGNFLMQFGEMGTENGQFEYPGPGPIYVDNAGNIFVSTFPRVQKFDADGNFLASYGTEGTGEGEFTGAALGTIDDEGNMYVADLLNARVEKLDPDGEFLLQWGSPGTEAGQFSYPVAIVQDSAGKLYVADNTPRIQIFDAEGNYLDQWSETGDGNPPLTGEVSGLAIDDEDNIYVADGTHLSIYVFRPF